MRRTRDLRNAQIFGLLQPCEYGEQTHMVSLELKVPPLIVFAVAAGAAWALSQITPTWNLEFGSAVVAAALLFALGTAVALAGVASFRSQGTTINPMVPERSARVVQAGVYRWSRNPMYLGMLLVLLAVATCLKSAAALVVLPAFVWYMNRFQIAPEERALLNKFGSEYAGYMVKVRRWL